MRDKAQRFAENNVKYREARQKLAAIKSARESRQAALKEEAAARIKTLRGAAEIMSRYAEFQGQKYYAKEISAPI